MSSLRLGRTMIIAKTAVSAGAGNITCAVKPDEVQTVWEILKCVGWHTAGGARTCVWYFHDPETDTPTGLTLSLAASTEWSLYGNATSPSGHQAAGPLVVTLTHYPTFVVTATGAAENMYVRALVREIRGVDCDGD